ncbi:AMP-binding protein, partial [Sulfobacillus thermosulfidooxidans]|uniref:AMP-binding protein n=1 Tax=Sulfobacillus thermosulfidooxidans TaxID=28034 RepID=UPI0006873604
MNKLLVHEILTDAAYQWGSIPVLGPQHSYTYEQIYERVLRLANKLEQLGVGRGTVVGVIDVNSHRYFELQYALSLIGAVIHTINYRLPLHDMLWTIRHAHDEWVFLNRQFDDLVEYLSPLVPHIVFMDPSGYMEEPDYETLIAEGKMRIPDSAQTISPTDTYSVFYTTGTTGLPKGIRYTHEQMLMGALQIAHHLALHDTGAKLTNNDVIMPLIPFFHIHGWGTPFIAPYLGLRLVFAERSGPSEQLELIDRYHVSWLNMVPTQLFMLLDEMIKNGSKQRSFKVLTGGSPLSNGLAQRAEQMGISFSLIYGGSDQLGSAISAVSQLSCEPRFLSLATTVTPLPMVRVEVRNDAGEQMIADGQSLGELWIQSPWLPAGYYNNPEESAKAYQDGWFRTGDLGVRYPDGRFQVMDRRKDAIKSGGEWIASTVIESVISEVPGVQAVAVIAKADSKWGERPYAVVQASQEVTEITLRTALQSAVDDGRLSKFWIPERFVFIERLSQVSWNFASVS